MRKKKKYLPLYYEWMESGQLTNGWGLDVCGLCDTEISESKFFLLIEPTNEEACLMPSPAYWGRESDAYVGGKFSPLRQNLVLLICAMNGEL